MGTLNQHRKLEELIISLTEPYFEFLEENEKVYISIADAIKDNICDVFDYEQSLKMAEDLYERYYDNIEKFIEIAIAVNCRDYEVNKDLVEYDM